MKEFMMARVQNASGATKSRRNRDAEIVNAATAVFSQKGYSAASLQDIADRVGILKGSLYHYISSKESLLFRILQTSHQEAEALMVSVDALDQLPEEKFLTFIERLSIWYLENSEKASLSQKEWRSLQGENAQIVRDQRRALRSYLSDQIAGATRQGLTRPDLDTELATRFILSAIGSIPTWYRTSTPANTLVVGQEIANLARSVVFRSTL
jgi:AcrR family transcriptional regulator